MPLNTNEVVRMREVVSSYLDREEAKELFSRLHEEIGLQSTNRSVAVSLFMLKEIFNGAEPRDLDGLYAGYYQRSWWTHLKDCLVYLVKG